MNCIDHLLVYFRRTLAPYSKTLALHSAHTQITTFTLKFKCFTFGSSVYTYMHRFGFQSISSTTSGEKQYIMATAKHLKHTREKINGYLCAFGCRFFRLFVYLFDVVFVVSLGYTASARGMLTNSTVWFCSWFEHQPMEKPKHRKHFHSNTIDRVEEIKKIHIIIVSSKEEHAISNVMKMFTSSYFVLEQSEREERRKTKHTTEI